MTNDVIFAAPMTIDEVAEALHCSERTVRRLIDAGRLRAVDLGGSLKHLWRVEVDELADFKRRESGNE